VEIDRVVNRDCLEGMRELEENSVDAIVTDPPYGLTFMGMNWDKGVPGVPYWQEALRVAKPGAHLLAFGGTRTHHRLMVAIEDAGWEIRDCLMWVFAQGMPKSLNIGKELDRRGGEAVAWFGPWLRRWREERGLSQKEVAALFPSKPGGLTGCVANWELGLNMPTVEQFNLIRDTFGLPFDSLSAAEREVVGHNPRPPGRFSSGDGHDITAPATDAAKQWDGWGTSLKPAYEIVILARKPLDGTVAETVLKWGCGGINIDGCRIGTDIISQHGRSDSENTCLSGRNYAEERGRAWSGRWPANLLIDEVAASLLDQQSGTLKSGANPARRGSAKFKNSYGEFKGQESCTVHRGANSGGASRFFYCSKASKKERSGSKHPTVKPLDLMRYLCRLVTPPGGLILDPFLGSGTTAVAAVHEGFHYLGFEINPTYCADAERRIAEARREIAAPRPNKRGNSASKDAPQATTLAAFGTEET